VNQKYVFYGIAIAMLIGFSFFAYFYTENFRTASKEVQNLNYAVLTGAAGIFIHFFKKYHRVKEQKFLEMFLESLQLLMLVASPTIVSYEIFKKSFPTNPDPIILVSIIAFSAWYFVTLYRVTRPEDANLGKFTLAISSILYAGILYFVGILVWIRLTPA
jgi:hypothetical protein